mmetsp:Transcript_23234/g.64422  ORF Transcript_23234/g.64422 Transcript_23234/m.64422 type:complete len:208 (-) Transcript_23234:172-795(-)
MIPKIVVFEFFVPELRLTKSTRSTVARFQVTCVLKASIKHECHGLLRCPLRISRTFATPEFFVRTGTSLQPNQYVSRRSRTVLRKKLDHRKRTNPAGRFSSLGCPIVGGFVCRRWVGFLEGSEVKVGSLQDVHVPPRLRVRRRRRGRGREGIGIFVDLGSATAWRCRLVLVVWACRACIIFVVSRRRGFQHRSQAFGDSFHDRKIQR